MTLTALRGSTNLGTMTNMSSVPRFTLEECADMRDGLPQWTREAVADARAAGDTWASIAHRLRVSERAAQKWLEKK